jgi:hypothetical protein
VDLRGDLGGRLAHGALAEADSLAPREAERQGCDFGGTRRCAAGNVGHFLIVAGASAPGSP